MRVAIEVLARPDAGYGCPLLLDAISVDDG